MPRSAYRRSPFSGIAAILAAAFAFGFLPGACKTAETAAEVKDSESSAGMSESLSLAQDEGQALYLLMLGAEIAAGVHVQKDQAHSVRGIARCRRDANIDSCEAFARLPPETLSPGQRLSGAVATKIGAFARGTRPELAKESSWQINAECNFLGKDSPPFEVEDVHCFVALPRTHREAVYSDPLAEELAEKVRGEMAFGRKKLTIAGTLACRYDAANGHPVCMVRVMKNGVVEERVQEVSARNAAGIAQALLDAAYDHAQFDRQDAGATTSVPPPTELSAALVCLVDGSNVDKSGARGYQCRASL